MVWQYYKNYLAYVAIHEAYVKRYYYRVHNHDYFFEVS